MWPSAALDVGFNPAGDDDEGWDFVPEGVWLPAEDEDQLQYETAEIEAGMADLSLNRDPPSPAD